MGKGDKWKISNEDKKILQMTCDQQLKDDFSNAKRIWAGKPAQKGKPIRSMDFLKYLLKLNK